MTDMKSIWHTKNETPRQESRVLWKFGNVVCGGRFDTHYKCFCGPASQFVDLKKVNRWCYIDELIKESDRTRKALDVATDFIKQVEDGDNLDDFGVCEDASEALTKITALKQKD